MRRSLRDHHRCLLRHLCEGVTVVCFAITGSTYGAVPAITCTTAFGTCMKTCTDHFASWSVYIIYVVMSFIHVIDVSIFLIVCISVNKVKNNLWNSVISFYLLFLRDVSSVMLRLAANSKNYIFKEILSNYNKFSISKIPSQHNKVLYIGPIIF